MGAGNGKRHRGKVKSITDAPQNDLGIGARWGREWGAGGRHPSNSGTAVGAGVGW